jgi:type IV secretion system protein VirB9
MMRHSVLIKFAMVLATTAVWGGHSALALRHPSKSSFDARIRYAPYNAHDVVQLNTVIGIATHVVLEEGEQYMTHAFGDANAYAFAVEKNHLFLKPKAENADTNLTVVTDRRSYHFRLTFQPSIQSSAIYQLVFTYPAQLKKAVLEKDFEHLGHECNLNYTMSGDKDISPIHAWDNGTFTYFKFAPNRDLPVVYMVDADDQESMVNRHSMGEAANIVVVHKVHDRWVLRLGDRALAIYNESCKGHPEFPATGTAVPTIQRIVKPTVGLKETPE